MTERTPPNDDVDPAQLERLLTDVSRLPRDIAPPPGAWREIRARIDAQRVRPIAPTAAHGRRAARPWWLGVAATILVTAGVWMTMSSRAKQTETASSAPSVAVGAAPVIPAAVRTGNPPLAAVLDDYQRATIDLETEVAKQEPNLAPATREVVRRSLAIIDTAIADLNAALSQDPANAAAGQSLSQAYARKVEFLKRVRQLPGTGM